MGFDYCHLGGEENEINYINKFKELYSNGVLIPEGIIIHFKMIPDSEITHVWRGGQQGPFNFDRAVRISWIKEILENRNKRVVKYNLKKRSVYFLSEKIGKRTYWAVRCIYEKHNKQYRFLTAFLLKPKQREKYLKWPNYNFKK
ncbi:hypothetical protein KJ854_04550 [Patescibacteria group bacterium]|nr:hypothetical protein [Patescibacteria group bacterium]MBU4142153.1 hypothetical protein [Patescibacteria group bacterium]